MPTPLFRTKGSCLSLVIAALLANVVYAQAVADRPGPPSLPGLETAAELQDLRQKALASPGDRARALSYLRPAMARLRARVKQSSMYDKVALQEQLDTASQILEVCPDVVDALNMRAQARMGLRQFSEAVDDLGRAVQITSRKAWPVAQTASLYEKLALAAYLAGRHPEAVTAWDTYRTVCGGLLAHQHVALILALISTGNARRVAQEWHAANERYPRSPELASLTSAISSARSTSTPTVAPSTDASNEAEQ